MNHIYDRRGRPIKQYDLLKVFHFQDARKHYMYNLCIADALDVVGAKDAYLVFSSLSECGHKYELQKKNQTLYDYEIIQGKDFENRKKQNDKN